MQDRLCLVADPVEPRKVPPRKDEKCLKCGALIPHGNPFVPVVCNKTDSHAGDYMGDTYFIGLSSPSQVVVQVQIGAICLRCMGCQ